MAVQELDFREDRIDWHERFDHEERNARIYGLSSLFVGEQRVAAELGPMMRACPDERMRIFLCTQFADEARHVAFFDRSTASSACSSTSCCAAASTASRPSPRTSRRWSKRSRSTTW